MTIQHGTLTNTSTGIRTHGKRRTSTSHRLESANIWFRHDGQEGPGYIPYSKLNHIFTEDTMPPNPRKTTIPAEDRVPKIGDRVQIIATGTVRTGGTITLTVDLDGPGKPTIQAQRGWFAEHAEVIIPPVPTKQGTIIREQRDKKQYIRLLGGWMLIDTVPRPLLDDNDFQPTLENYEVMYEPKPQGPLPF